MLKALFGSAKDDPYNQALDHFRKLRDLSTSDPAYLSNIMAIIRLCQLAIRQRPTDGDAHILLANAYLLTALSEPFGDLYAFALARGAAAIHQWKSVPMKSKARAIGEKIMLGIQDQLAKDRPDWMGPNLPNDFAKLHFDYYEGAIDPSALDQMSRLVGALD